jgi:hypothetical protein
MHHGDVERDTVVVVCISMGTRHRPAVPLVTSSTDS